MRKKGYGSFSPAQLWHWHAYDYGFQRIYRVDAGVISPIDTTGEWFNPEFADAAEAFFRSKITAHKRNRHVASAARDAYARSVGFKNWHDREAAIQAQQRNDEEMIREGKRIGNEWAQQRGFPTLDAYGAAHGLDYAAVRKEVAHWYLKRAEEKWRKQRAATVPTPRENQVYLVRRHGTASATRDAKPSSDTATHATGRPVSADDTSPATPREN